MTCVAEAQGSRAFRPKFNVLCFNLAFPLPPAVIAAPLPSPAGAAEAAVVLRPPVPNPPFTAFPRLFFALSTSPALPAAMLRFLFFEVPFAAVGTKGRLADSSRGTRRGVEDDFFLHYFFGSGSGVAIMDLLSSVYEVVGRELLVELEAAGKRTVGGVGGLATFWFSLFVSARCESSLEEDSFDFELGLAAEEHWRQSPRHPQVSPASSGQSSCPAFSPLPWTTWMSTVDSHPHLLPSSPYAKPWPSPSPLPPSPSSPASTSPSSQHHPSSSNPSTHSLDPSSPPPHSQVLPPSSYSSPSPAPLQPPSSASLSPPPPPSQPTASSPPSEFLAGRYAVLARKDAHARGPVDFDHADLAVRLARMVDEARHTAAGPVDDQAPLQLHKVVAMHVFIDLAHTALAF
ncbi:hypothetical protein KC366_g36 [Hortaea werneckii]|nr:hypothetical protein KC366_g36 [Hortaea werneckii]